MYHDLLYATAWSVVIIAGLLLAASAGVPFVVVGALIIGGCAALLVYVARKH